MKHFKGKSSAHWGKSEHQIYLMEIWSSGFVATFTLFIQGVRDLWSGIMASHKDNFWSSSEDRNMWLWLNKQQFKSWKPTLWPHQDSPFICWQSYCSIGHVHTIPFCIQSCIIDVVIVVVVSLRAQEFGQLKTKRTSSMPNQNYNKSI